MKVLLTSREQIIYVFFETKLVSCLVVRVVFLLPSPSHGHAELPRPAMITSTGVGTVRHVCYGGVLTSIFDWV
jgi:hypothetical protein